MAETRRFRSGLGALLGLTVCALSSCASPEPEPAGGEAPGGPLSAMRPTVERVDLLLMVDNSSSMAAKQQLLQQAVPELVNRLVNPLCVGLDAAGARTTQPPPVDPGAPCPEPLRREFAPIADIHLAVITSSLGGHGADSCAPGGGGYNLTQNDHAHTIGSVRDGLYSANDSGFLAWAPDGGACPQETDPAELGAAFQQHIAASGHHGCSFEASLESWYRFLIDPEPPAEVVRVPCFEGDTNNGCAVADGLDKELLEQRAAFLRADSLLAVIMLTDENDCSVIDGGQSYISVQAVNGTQAFLLPRSTVECEADPNDPCCYSCKQATPADCHHDKSENTSCSVTEGVYTQPEDRLDVRCFDQKRRFGIDFLYPTSRYINGLLDRQVPNRSGELVSNPIYTDLGNTGATPRDSSLVFLAGIVGVPYQDIIASEQTCTDTGGAICPPAEGVEYLTASELQELSRWDVMLGDPTTGTPPTDLHMIESIEPRPGLPGMGVGARPDEDLHGHEYDTENKDLQYACIFRLTESVDCDEPDAPANCESTCDAGTAFRDDPLCQDPNTGDWSTRQHYDRGYPGLRQLQVLRDFGENAVVASVCPAEPLDTASPSFGYLPAIDALLDRLRQPLGDRCMARELALTTETGGDPQHPAVDCTVVEVTRGAGGGCAPPAGQESGGPLPARTELDPALRPRVLEALDAQGLCRPGESCDDFTFCAVNQTGGAARQACQEQLSPTGAAGFCYLDEANGIGNPQLLSHCDQTARRSLRFIGDVPAEGATVLTSCRLRTLGDESVEVSSLRRERPEPPRARESRR